MFSEQRTQQYYLMLDFLADCVSPEGYGHALPPEVIRRVARILKHLPANEQRLAQPVPHSMQSA